LELANENYDYYLKRCNAYIKTDNYEGIAIFLLYDCIINTNWSKMKTCKSSLYNHIFDTIMSMC